MESRIERALDIEAQRNQFNAEEGQRLSEAAQTEEEFIASHTLITSESEKKELLQSGKTLSYFNGFTMFELSFNGEAYILAKDGREADRARNAFALEEREIGDAWYY